MTLHSDLEKLEREPDDDLPPLPPGFVYVDERQRHRDALRADMAAGAWESNTWNWEHGA